MLFTQLILYYSYILFIIISILSGFSNLNYFYFVDVNDSIAML